MFVTTVGTVLVREVSGIRGVPAKGFRCTYIAVCASQDDVLPPADILTWKVLPWQHEQVDHNYHRRQMCSGEKHTNSAYINMIQ